MAESALHILRRDRSKPKQTGISEFKEAMEDWDISDLMSNHAKERNRLQLANRQKGEGRSVLAKEKDQRSEETETDGGKQKDEPHTARSTGWSRGPAGSGQRSP
jgi:hypothetical protein